VHRNVIVKCILKKWGGKMWKDVDWIYLVQVGDLR